MEINLVQINGEEGGGQIFRSALALSMLTGKTFNIDNIRKRRPKPGLQPQHLEALHAAHQISNAKIEGCVLNSTMVSFVPGDIKSGHYEFRIKTAGSISLLLHAVYLPLAFAGGSSELLFQGGTHVSWSPTFNYLQECWLWFMKQIGLNIELELVKPGFYPHGGGIVKAYISPVTGIKPLKLTQRGDLRKIKIYSAQSNLSNDVARRQADAAHKILNSFLNSSGNIEVQCEALPSFSRNTTIALTAVFEHSVCCFTELGEKGKPAERVAADACAKLIDFLKSDATVDEHMSDQLLLPLSFSSFLSEFTCNKATAHFQTNFDTISKFLGTPPNVSVKISP